MTDTHMEELVEQARAMATGEPEGPRYHGDALLAPDTDFMTDDRSSAASGLDVSERLSYLEQRVQMQEDEIQLLKMALADVLKRLNLSEEKKASAKATRPAFLALPPRPSPTSSAAPARKSISSTPPSTASSRNYTPSTSTKRSPVDPPGTPSKARSSTTTTSVTCKKQDRKPGASVAGTRRVAHCKVTMQIYLSRQSRRTGSSESVTPTPVPSNHTEPAPAKNPPPRVADVTACDWTKLAPLPSPRQSPAFPVPLHKATPSPCHSVTSFSPLGTSSFRSSIRSRDTPSIRPHDTPSHRSSIRSPNQYLQICY